MDCNIACVIVTYNRKTLLKRCLDAVDAQTYKPKVVYITDNASTDGTMESVKEWGYYNCERNGIEYKYILNSKNEGGAGGFYLGMKTAFEAEKPDGLWVMDDDGVPERDCLKELSLHLGSYHFISPLVVSDQDPTQTSFYHCSVADFSKRFNNGIYVGEANPFNGVLFSKKLIDTIGYPKREMFIWGDEQNYMRRTIHAGFDLCIILKAVHRHPMDRQVLKDTIYGTRVLSTLERWKLYCYIRNTTYNETLFQPKLRGFLHSIKKGVAYSYYYCVKEKRLLMIPVIWDAILSGFMGNFDRLTKYRTT